MFYILCLVCVLTIAFGANPTARFPLQFTADLLITSHMISESSVFPPRTRTMKVYYDYITKRARADIAEGFEASKTYIRRYDMKNEYMIRHPPINDCKRSYLSETMPFPEIPTEAKYQGVKIVDGLQMDYYVFEEENMRINMYFQVKTHSPYRLIEEAVEDSVSVPYLTYDFTNVELGAVDELEFELPDSFSHGTCDRHIGGFPYLHIFHYFVRF